MTPEEIARYAKIKLEAGLSFAGQNRYAAEAGFVLVDDAGYGAAAPSVTSPRTKPKSREMASCGEKGD